jgi:hypothetical protein
VRPWFDPDTTLEKAAFLAVGYSIWMANGWTIAKLHRPYSTAMVFAYVIWSIVASVPPIYDVVVSTVTGSTDASALAQVLVMRTVTIMALMTGGALAAYRDQLKRRAQDWRQDSPRAFAAR